MGRKRARQGGSRNTGIIEVAVYGSPLSGAVRRFSRFSWTGELQSGRSGSFFVQGPMTRPPEVLTEFPDDGRRVNLPSLDLTLQFACFLARNR